MTTGRQIKRTARQDDKITGLEDDTTTRLHEDRRTGLQEDYYLGGKNLSARLHAYLRLESTNHQKIGELIKALQICKRLMQTASL